MKRGEFKQLIKEAIVEVFTEQPELISEAINVNSSMILGPPQGQNKQVLNTIPDSLRNQLMEQISGGDPRIGQAFRGRKQVQNPQQQSSNPYADVLARTASRMTPAEWSGIGGGMDE